MPITFLSDFGAQDDFVGVCHAVIFRIAREARVIDLAHGLPPSEVRPAALVLRNTLPFTPTGVHLAVVDPGVGTDRRPVALRTADGRFFVGPDNGLLSLAAAKAGGVESAVDLRDSPFRLEPVSATFHGRDLFAPVAAHLALGTPLEQVGSPVPVHELVGLELPRATVSKGEVEAHAVYIDRFGNVQLNLAKQEMGEAGFVLGGPIGVDVGGEAHPCTYVRTFGDVAAGELIAYEDAYHVIALAVSRGSAADALGLRIDQPLRLTPRVPG